MKHTCLSTIVKFTVPVPQQCSENVSTPNVSYKIHSYLNPSYQLKAQNLMELQAPNKQL